jgi:hypothetical protein
MGSFRGRRLKEEGVVPSLFSEFVESLEAYLWGSDLRSFRYYGGFDRGTFADRLATKLGGSSVGFREELDRHLRTDCGTSIHKIFIENDDERARTDGLFDLIEYLVWAASDPRAMMEAEVTSYVNGLFRRENQPYEVRVGRVLLAQQPDQVEILTGLAALAPTPAIAADLKKAELAFFDPRDDRRDEGLLLMARAYDAAKRSDGGPKETFDKLISRSFTVPTGARPDALDASRAMFQQIGAIASEIVRHGGPDKIEFATDEMKSYWFFVLASTVRLLYTRPEATAAP